MREALMAALLTGLATGVGALPLVFVRDLPRRAYDGVLGLGAGLMLAAATLGLLSEALDGVRGPAGLDLAKLGIVTTGFVAGVIIAVAMDRFIPHGHARGHRQHLPPEESAPPRGHHLHVPHEPAAHAHHHSPQAHPHHHSPQAHGEAGHAHQHPRPAQPQLRQFYFVLGAISIHRLPEGLAIGAGFAVPENQLGWMLSVAVGLQNVCEGMVMVAPLRQGGLSALRSLLLVSATGMVVPLGAALGYSLSGVALPALPFVLALAGGTLIYVTSNEIIPESHSHGHEGTASAGVITGFLLTMLLGALIR
jgi:ZIP family zinc transporter